MKLEWTDRETVYIPDVGTVGQGTIFDIADDRGQDLLNRGAARRPLAPVQQDQPEEIVTPKVKTNIQQGTVKQVIVTDSIVAGDR